MTAGLSLVAITTQANMSFISVNSGYFIGILFYGIPPITTTIITILMVSRLMAVRGRHAEIMGMLYRDLCLA
jgi:hypothetical protein